MGACGSKPESSKKKVLIAKAKARERPLFEPKSDREVAAGKNGERIMTLADIANTKTSVDDFSISNSTNYPKEQRGDDTVEETLRTSASQKYRDIYNVDEINKSPRADSLNTKNMISSYGYSSSTLNSPESKNRLKGTLSKMIAVQRFRTGSAEMAAAPYEAVDTSPLPYSRSRMNSDPVSSPSNSLANSPSVAGKKDLPLSWGKLRNIVSINSALGKASGTPSKYPMIDSESGSNETKSYGAESARILADPGYLLKQEAVGSSGSNARFAEFQRLRALNESALFEEVAACPGIELSQAEAQDLHALCVAIVKYRFDGDQRGNGGDIRSAELGVSVPPSPPLFADVSTNSPYNAIRPNILSDQHYIPRQSPISGSDATGKTAPSSGNERGTLSTRNRLELGMPATAPLTSWLGGPVQKKNVFYAADHASQAATESETDTADMDRQRERGWRYSGAVAKDAKNVLSQMKLGKHDLPPTARRVLTGNNNTTNGVQNTGTETKKFSHWDTAINAAKAKSAMKAVRGQRPPGGGLTQARVARIVSPKTTSSPGGWLSELSDIEKDVEAANKTRVRRAMRKKQLREEQDRAIDEVMGRMTPPMSSPLTQSVLDSSHAEVMVAQPLDESIRSTLYAKRVRLKPSLSDCTRGARAGVVSTPKVSAPARMNGSTGGWRPRSKLRPVADSPLTAVPLSAFDDDREEPVSSYVEAVSYKDNGGGPGAESEGADRKSKPDHVGLNFTGRRPRDHSLFKRSEAIKQAVEKASKVSADVKRAQLRKGIRSDGGAVGIFT